jgi:hypothetical protein
MVLLRELGRISALLTAAGHEFLILKRPYFRAALLWKHRSS